MAIFHKEKQKHFSEPMKATTLYLSNYNLDIIAQLIQAKHAPNRSEFVRDALTKYLNQMKLHMKFYELLKRQRDEPQDEKE